MVDFSPQITPGQLKNAADGLLGRIFKKESDISITSFDSAGKDKEEQTTKKQLPKDQFSSSTEEQNFNPWKSGGSQ
ncbi:MAG: hypothetical protein SFT81_05925 [Candidatus Caenarcaniphilales bacterium]|nr:hypothetical protein [Candidatus Caenarcaniphilales bacterium]